MAAVNNGWPLRSGARLCVSVCVTLTGTCPHAKSPAALAGRPRAITERCRRPVSLAEFALCALTGR